MESGVFHSTYKKDMALRPTPIMKGRLIFVIALALIFPFMADNYQLTLANQVGIFAIAAIGLNILTGFTGQISLGTGGFMAIGAYSSGLLVTNLGVPWWLTLPIASLVTAVVGGFFGLPSLRLKGLYLAIATLAAQQVIEWAIIRSPWTGGVEALVIPSPTLFGIRMSSDFNFYWIILLTLAVVVMFTVNLFRTKIGRAFIAIRDQDIAAEVMGVNVFMYKVMSFATSSFIIGFAGALLAQYRGIVNYERFTIELSITILAMIIIGGLGSVSGSIYGAILIALLPAVLSNMGTALSDTIPSMLSVIPFIQKGMFGVVIIVFLIFEPEGIAKIWRNIKDYFRLWPFSY